MNEKLPAFLQNIDTAALIQNCIRIGVIVVIALIIWWLIRLAISRFVKRMIDNAEASGQGVHGSRERAETIGGLLRKVIGVVYWVMILLTILSQVGVDIGALIAGAGIFGLAFAFGAQQLVKNYVSGFFIVLENQISIGDIAVINGTWGTVEEINFRTTVLRGTDGVVHMFPNGGINELSNATKGWGGYLFKIAVAHNVDADHVISVLKRIGDDIKENTEFGQHMIADMEIHGVNSINNEGYVIRGLFKTTPMNQWATGRAFLKRVKEEFAKEGIEVPSSHRTINFGTEGAASLQIEPIGSGGESNA